MNLATLAQAACTISISCFSSKTYWQGGPWEPYMGGNKHAAAESFMMTLEHIANQFPEHTETDQTIQNFSTCPLRSGLQTGLQEFLEMHLCHPGLQP